MTGRRFFQVAIGMIGVLFAGLWHANAQESDLVAAVSSENVLIQSNFTGTEIVVFGQIETGVTTQGEQPDFDVVIAVEGPGENITTRRKDRILGVWVNRYYETFESIPSFYSVASTRPISELAAREVLDEKGIGIFHINLPVTGKSNVPFADREGFRKAFLRLRQDDGLYAERSGSVEFLTKTMFRTTIPLPANISVGSYKVRSYLFSNGSILAEKQEKLEVRKAGFEQITYNMSRHYPLAYGALAVLLAISTGWLAGVLFRKD